MPVKKENTLNKCFINTRPLKTGPREGKPKPSCLHWIKKRRSVFVDLDKRGVCGPAYILPPHTNAEPTKTNKKYSDKISNKKNNPKSVHDRQTFHISPPGKHEWTTKI